MTLADTLLYMYVCEGEGEEGKWREGGQGRSYLYCSNSTRIWSTVEPPNKGHFGNRAFVLFSEAVLWWEVRPICNL